MWLRRVRSGPVKPAAVKRFIECASFSPQEWKRGGVVQNLHAVVPGALQGEEHPRRRHASGAVGAGGSVGLERDPRLHDESLEGVAEQCPCLAVALRFLQVCREVGQALEMMRVFPAENAAQKGSKQRCPRGVFGDARLLERWANCMFNDVIPLRAR